MGLTLCGLYQRLFPYVTPRVEPLLGSLQVFGRSHLPTFPSPADPELGLWAPLLPIPSICQTALGNHVTQGTSVSQKSLLAPGPQGPHEGVHSPISTLGVPGSNPRPPTHTLPAAAGTPVCLFLPLLLLFSLSPSLSIF